MKKVISILLVVILLVSAVSGYAAECPLTQDADFEVLDNSATLNYTSEIVSVNDLQKYYFDNDQYTITIEELENGSKNAYYKNKSQNTIYSYNIIDTSTFDEIRVKILNENYEPISVASLATPSVSARVRSDPAQLIGTKLAGTYGQQYTEKFITSILYEGYYGGIYEDMSFYMTKKIDYLAYAGVAATLVATALSWPLSSVMLVCTCVSLASGIVAIKNDVTASVYTAKVGYEKNVHVLSNTTYCVGKTITYDALVGDKDCALKHINTIKDGNFDNNTQILQTGIDNYIKYWK